jgi:hypothetical protein
MSNLSQKFREEQIFFLKNQFWSLTIQAAFSRANVYNSDINKQNFATEKQKASFKLSMYKYINDELIPKLENSNNLELSVFNAIEELQKWSANQFGSILKLETLSFGVCQKILNLYLKYLWCAGFINFTPPLFPLDRLIQEKTIKKVLTNWTTFNDGIKKYSEIMNEIHKDNNKAEWELTEYNNILKNG